MFPILHEQNENTATQFQKMGLGTLTETISCTVTEERNGEFTLSLTYPMTGRYVKQITAGRIICAKPSDDRGVQAFRIYKVKKTLGGQLTVSAEHISYQLAHIPVIPFAKSKADSALAALVANCAEDCPFDFTVSGTFSEIGFSFDVPKDARSLLYGSEGSFVDTYGGEWLFDNYSATLCSSRGKDSGAWIRYGVNLTDLTQENKISNTVTGIFPYWYGKGSDGNGTLVTLSEKTIDGENAGNFPYKRTAVVDFSDEFDAQPTESELRKSAKSYVTKNTVGVPEVSLTVSFVDLRETADADLYKTLQSVNLCDTVQVYYSDLDISASSKVVKTVYDVLKERFSSISLGDAKQNFGKTLVQAIRKSNK